MVGWIENVGESRQNSELFAQKNYFKTLKDKEFTKEKGSSVVSY